MAVPSKGIVLVIPSPVNMPSPVVGLPVKIIGEAFLHISPEAGIPLKSTVGNGFTSKNSVTVPEQPFKSVTV